MLFCFKRGVWVSCDGLHALGTVLALQTACVGVLYGGHGALSTRSGLLSAGFGVRLGEAGSVHRSRGTICKRSGLCVVGLVLVHVQPGFYLHQEVALFSLKTVFLVR